MRNRTHETPVVYQATFRDGAPVRPRAVLCEDLPAHADMLRYDLAFHSPADPSLVIFPHFRHKTDGSYPNVITVNRWRSFSITLHDSNNRYAYIEAHPVSNWITYQHPEEQQHGLVPVALDAWLKAHPKVSIWGWRSIPAVSTGKYWAVTG